MDVDLVFAYAVQGFALGFQGGLSPGPFTSLVISESLQHGRRAGMRCSLAPLISDPPVVLLALLLLSGFSGAPWVLRGVSFVGALLLGWLAWKSFRVRAEQYEKPPGEGKSLLKAVGVNLLNPNPYIYWVSISGPLVLTAARTSIPAAAAFVILFYVGLVGIKATIGFVAGGARHRLNTTALVWANRVVGVVMVGFAMVLLSKAIWGLEVFE